MKMTVDESLFDRERPLSLFIRYYRYDVRLFVLDMFCAILIAWVDLLFPMVTRFALTNYLPEKKYTAFFLSSERWPAGSFCAVMQFIVTYWGHLMGANIEMRMRYDLFSHIQNCRTPFSIRPALGQ